MSSQPTPTSSYRLAPCYVAWTESQEKALVKDYPFVDIDKETSEEHVARIYLQHLWLPESIMPLSSLIPSLLRVNVASSSTGPHLLLSHLKRILLSGRVASDKYREQLPQVISDGGGAGELEEMVMWYALSYEKNDQLESQSKPGSPERMEELAADQKWLSTWFERMERREIAIQLLLHMLVLTLPGTPSASSSPKKRKRGSHDDTPKHDSLSKDMVEARIQVYMDKLSTWQLVDSLETQAMPSSTETKDNGHDWSQSIYLSVIEPRFKHSLPELCDEMHMKLFPYSHSMFSDDDEGISSPPSRSSSPQLESQSQQPSRKRAKTTDTSRQPSPALSAASTKATRSLVRSRSLSVTLAQERQQSLGAITKKRVLNREVSMSRVFRSKPKPQQEAKPVIKDPVKRPPPPKKDKEEEKLLVEATPVKSRPSGLRRQSTTPAFFLKPPQLNEEPLDEEEEEWRLPSSSPDILLLKTSSGEDEEFDYAPPTPTKRRKK